MLSSAPLADVCGRPRPYARHDGRCVSRADRRHLVADGPVPREEKREGEAMDQQTKTMSRDEVATLERRAWTEADGEGSRLYVYDGINFWYCCGRMQPEQIPAVRAPQSGWRHHVRCLRGVRGTSDGDQRTPDDGRPLRRSDGLGAMRRP